MNFRAALVAEGYCQEVGFESPAAGKFCRTKGVTLDEIKRFCTNGYRMILGMVTLLVLKLARHYLFGVVKESAKKAVRVSIARLRATVILMTAKWSSTMNTVRLTLPSVLPGARELGALFKIPIL